MNQTELATKIGKILEDNYFEKNEEGYYEYEVYVDYRDELSDNQVEEICQSDDKMQAFYECLDEWIIESEGYYLSEIRKKLKEELDDDYYEHEDFILDWLMENVVFKFPYDHFLNKTVYVNIIVDTGDGGCDFTLNNFDSLHNPNLEIDEKSSIYWLVKQQGYSKEDLSRALEEGRSENKFLDSVVVECFNVGSHMNALVFLVSMTLKEFITFVDEDKDDIKISVGTTCGLFDRWSGGGSILEIELEKTVIIPREYARPYIDGTKGYSVAEVYGMMRSAWK